MRSNEDRKMDREWLVGKVTAIGSEKLRAACMTVIDDDRFFVSPAAAKKHQAWDGGLAQHTREVMEIALAMADAECLQASTSTDVIVAGVLWHDYGKIWDYKRNPNVESPYAPAGEPKWVYDRHRWTVRHLSRSYAEFLRAAEAAGCATNEIEEVSHCILAHHGRNEWGSPVTPLSLEASIIHYADCIDAFHVDKEHPFRADRIDWKEARAKE